MLTSAKHPRTLDLLQKALAEATSPTPRLNGETEAKEPPEVAEASGEATMKPIKKQKEGTVSMAKINNYGRILSHLARLLLERGQGGGQHMNTISTVQAHLLYR